MKKIGIIFVQKNIQLNLCSDLLQFLAHLSHSQIVQKLYKYCINLIECFLDKKSYLTVLKIAINRTKLYKSCTKI